jgi:hypothetical protein
MKIVACPTFDLPDVRNRAVASVKADADRFARTIAPIIREIQLSGVASHRGIARSLNARGVATARCGQWTARYKLARSYGVSLANKRKRRCMAPAAGEAYRVQIHDKDEHASTAALTYCWLVKLPDPVFDRCKPLI